MSIIIQRLSRAWLQCRFFSPCLPHWNLNLNNRVTSGKIFFFKFLGERGGELWINSSHERVHGRWIDLVPPPKEIMYLKCTVWAPSVLKGLWSSLSLLRDKCLKAPGRGWSNSLPSRLRTGEKGTLWLPLADFEIFIKCLPACLQVSLPMRLKHA